MQTRIDWRSVGFDWNRAKAFLVTAEQGSLSAAAKVLAVAQPTLGRQVAALELELGLKLFERRGRGLVLTPTGAALVDHVRSMGEAAARLSLAAASKAEEIEGGVRVSASEVVATYRLPRIVAALNEQFPAIEVGIIASNTASDLKGREADIAIRLFEPTQSDLITKRVGDLVAHFYATPGYLRSIGYPQQLTDLQQARFIGAEDNTGFIGLMKSQGLHLSARNFTMVSQSRVVQWEMVKNGLGITVMPDFVGDAEPRVQRVDVTVAGLRGPMWLVAHGELRTSRRVRTVFDFIAKALAA
jgi:DNA-binding transcriptional LysR family regulator